MRDETSAVVVDAVRRAVRRDHRGELEGRTLAFLPRHGRDTGSPLADQLPRERLRDERSAPADPFDLAVAA